MVPESQRPVFEKQMINIPLEDVAVYEAQQRAIDLDPEARDGDVRPRGMIAADKGLFAMRKILQRLYGHVRGHCRGSGHDAAHRLAPCLSEC